jgi:hypothetical protein
MKTKISKSDWTTLLTFNLFTSLIEPITVYELIIKLVVSNTIWFIIMLLDKWVTQRLSS